MPQHITDDDEHQDARITQHAINCIYKLSVDDVHQYTIIPQLSINFPCNKSANGSHVRRHVHTSL